LLAELKRVFNPLVTVRRAECGLEDANKPLHLNDLLEQMYGKVSDQTFQRAKVSLANVLSTGMGKGRWKSAGKGFYAGNKTVVV
ncbi:MAG: hypothetical protein DCF22_13815, partial [Leptolyngbya sp.]